MTYDGHLVLMRKKLTLILCHEICGIVCYCSATCPVLTDANIKGAETVFTRIDI